MNESQSEHKSMKNERERRSVLHCHSRQANARVKEIDNHRTLKHCVQKIQKFYL